MIYAIIRSVKFGLQNFLRNFWLSVATLTVIIITLLLVNIVIVINQVKVATLTAIQNQVDISLDFKESVSQAEVQKVKSKLLDDDRIATVDIITPEENLERFKERYPEIGSKVLPVIEKNPLGYTLTVSASKIEDYESILQDLENDPELADITENTHFNDYRLFTSKASQLSERVNMGALVFAGIFFVIALIIVFNTIRVSIYTHRDEIAIMRLVGASNWFIQSPFIVEALLYGLVSVGLVVLIVFSGLQFFDPMIDRFFANFVEINLTEYYAHSYLAIFGLQLIAVVIISTLGTMIAIRRYLKI